MKIDCLEKLEFNEIKKILNNYCKTHIGKSIALSLLPSNNKEIVQNLLNETSEAVNLSYRNSFPIFYEIADINIYLKQLESGSYLSCKPLLDLANIFKLSSELKDYFNKDFLDLDEYPILYSLFSKLYTNKDITNKIFSCIIDEETLDDKASKSLLSIRKQMRNLEQDIKSKLNNMLHSSKYSKYIQESLVTTRSNRFVIPVKQEYRSEIKGFVHDISNAGSTVFIEPISIFEMNNELNTLKNEEELEIEKILTELTKLFHPYIENLKLDTEIIGKLDFIFAKSRFSKFLDAITPVINDEKYINLINARHPLIDSSKVVPISINIGQNFSSLLITGPNTGRKNSCFKNSWSFSLYGLQSVLIFLQVKILAFTFLKIFLQTLETIKVYLIH